MKVAYTKTLGRRVMRNADLPLHARRTVGPMLGRHVAGCSPWCDRCDWFVHVGGGCPGVSTDGRTRSPVCFRTPADPAILAEIRAAMAKGELTW